MPGPTRLLLTAVLAFATSAAAQNLAWDIPHRGAHVYTRTTQQFAVTPPPSRLLAENLIAAGNSPEPHRWRYLAAAADSLPAGFEQPGFDDAQWSVGAAGFGPEAQALGAMRTTWNSHELGLRTSIDFGRQVPKALRFIIDHDDGVRIWLNGKLIVADDGCGKGRVYVVMGKALEAWQRGANLLAARCTNVVGDQYFDLALTAYASLPRGMRSVADLQAALREQNEAAAHVQRALFGAYRPPPMLLQGELDGDRRHVPTSPADLRELAWWVATDLRGGALSGSLSLEARRMYELGDLRLRGRQSAIEPDGWQTIEVTVKNKKEPDAGGDSKRFVDRFVKRYVHYGFDGRLTVRRRLEITDRGARVVAFETDLDGTILTGKDWQEAAAGLRQRERWQFATTYDNQDAAFRALVRQAIDRGTARLRQQLANVDDGELKSQGPDADNSYHSGRLAIGLLALLVGGVPHDDEVVQKCRAELARRPLIDTYSLGNAIMAIEALYAPSSEAGQLRAGTIDRPQKRQPSPADLQLLQTWTDQLLSNIDTRVDPAYLLRFNYTAGDRYDHSVNQYGLLGLYSAHLCGVQIRPSVWEAAANHLLDAQVDGKKKRQLELVDYRTHERRRADPTATVTIARSYATPRGWSYYGPRDDGENAEVWGSMTCAGITGLAICQAALQDHPDLRRNKLQNDANRARNDGFAWLAEHLTVRHHPGALTRQRRWLYYYLYGLERAALLSGVALIQDRDWYFEGAMMLVLSQQADGHWPAELGHDLAIERNAMAILFLEQSTRPVLTGR